MPLVERFREVPFRLEMEGSFFWWTSWDWELEFLALDAGGWG